MTSTPLSAHPARLTWYTLFLVDRSRMLRATVALSVGLAAAWSLGADNFGILQSALALATILAAVCSLGLDPLVRERLKLHPLQTSSTLGTGLALRCAAGILVYFAMVMFTHSGQPFRSVWLVAALLVLTQTPLLIGLRFEDPAHRPRAIFAHNIALILSFLMVGMMVWIGADPVWFAAAIVLEQPLAGLFLLLGHDRVAPEEETFHWEWSAAQEWLNICWKPLGAVLLTFALLPIGQLLLIWRSTPASAGYFGITAVLFEFGVFCASVVILGRLTASQTSPDEVPLSTETTATDDFNRAASVGWVLALAVAGISALLAFTLFRKAASSVVLTGALLGAALVPLSLGMIRDAYWRRAGYADRTVIARSVAVVTNLILAFWLAPKAGAVGVAGSTLIALIIGEIVMTLFPGHAPRLARAQAPALLPLGLWHGAKVSAKVPVDSSDRNPPEPEDSAFITLHSHTLPTADRGSSATVSPTGAVAKSP